jgi:hypothetical protein
VYLKKNNAPTKTTIKNETNNLKRLNINNSRKKNVVLKEISSSFSSLNISSQRIFLSKPINGMEFGTLTTAALSSKQQQYLSILHK